MRFRAAFVVLLIVFGLVVLGAIVTTAKYVETHQAEQHPVKAKRAGWVLVAFALPEGLRGCRAWRHISAEAILGGEDVKGVEIARHGKLTNGRPRASRMAV
jgi:hypothetical protein